jgi:hypothetical protein
MAQLAVLCKTLAIAQLGITSRLGPRSPITKAAPKNHRVFMLGSHTFGRVLFRISDERVDACIK